MRRIAVVLVVSVLCVVGACGGDDDDDAEATLEELDDAVTDVGEPAEDDGATDDGFPRECPVTTEDVVTVLGEEVTQDGDLCAWRTATILVEVQTFGPGGSGFLDTWRDDITAGYGQAEELDRGDGGVVGSEDHQAQAYVETDEASYLVFVGGVVCFDTQQYEDAVVNLMDVALGEDPEPVTGAECPDPATGSVTTTPGDSGSVEVTP